MHWRPHDSIAPVTSRDAGPLVSVIVATNRAGAYLDEALTSAAAQTWSNLEIIVVDDGSPDEDAVRRSVGRVAGARLLRQPPSGVSIARNVGVAASSGEFLAFLDDDDRWRKDRIELQVVALLEAPDSVASYCAMRTIDAAGTKELAPADQVAVTSRLDIASRRTGIILPGLVIRRSAFAAAGGFHSRIRLAQDFDLILRLAELGDMTFVPETLVDYRASPQNVTRRYRELTRSIDRILAFHRWAAKERGDEALVGALDESIRKNERFAWWSASRRARADVSERSYLHAASELWWAMRAAPRGLITATTRRLRAHK